MKIKIPLIALIVFLGITPGSGAGLCRGKARLWVTEGFAKPPILERDVTADGRNVMEVLNANAAVETAYAGSFVSGINGIPGASGGRKKDWFYYVNGVLADAGALGYFPVEGDIVWWNLHKWGGGMHIGAVIGSYPQPFAGTSGTPASPTVVYVAGGLKEKGAALKESMSSEGVKEITVKTLSKAGEFDYPKNIYLVVGPWEDLKENEFIKGIYANYAKTGFCVRFERGGIRPISTEKEALPAVSEGAAIIAAKIGFGRNNPIWFITGTSDSAVSRACDLLIERPGEIRFYSAAIVSAGGVINVPVQK